MYEVSERKLLIGGSPCFDSARTDVKLKQKSLLA